MCLLIYLHLFYQSGVNKRSWIFALLPSTCSLQSMVNIINSFSLIVISFIPSLLHKSTDSGFWYVTVEFLISSRMLPKFFFLTWFPPYNNCQTSLLQVDYFDMFLFRICFACMFDAKSFNTSTLQYRQECSFRTGFRKTL